MRINNLEFSPVYLGKSHKHFGMLVRPDTVASECGLIIFNAGLLHHVGPYQLHRNIATDAASLGVPALVIDQSSKGESTARTNVSREESLLLDYDDALAFFAKLGVKKVILAGLCSGADDAIEVANLRDSVSGLILLDGYAKKTLRYYALHFGPRLRSWRAWLGLIKLMSKRIRHVSMYPNPGKVTSTSMDIRSWSSDVEMLSRYRHLFARGTKILNIFTGGQGYYNHLGQAAESIGPIASSGIHEELYFYDSDHLFTAVRARDEVLQSIKIWLERLAK